MLWSHVFPWVASFSDTVNTVEGNGVAEKEGGLPVFDQHFKHFFFFFFFFPTAEITVRLMCKIDVHIPAAEGLKHIYYNC